MGGRRRKVRNGSENPKFCLNPGFGITVLALVLYAFYLDSSEITFIGIYLCIIFATIYSFVSFSFFYLCYTEGCNHINTKTMNETDIWADLSDSDSKTYPRCG